jgi:hypothetical protein
MTALRIAGKVERDARIAELIAFLERKGSGGLRSHEAILCVLYWVERGASGPVRAREISLLYPRHDGRRLPPATQELRHHVERGLAESLGDGRYRLTPLGRQVVEALPDRAEVARLRGLRSPSGHRDVG